MAAVGSTLPAGAALRGRATGPRLPYGWPVDALFLGFPLWWVLGLGAFIWPLPALPMAISLITRPRLWAPRGFEIYVLFVLWMLASGLQVSGPDRIFGFAYRVSLYLSAGILGLYVYNAPRHLLPTATVVRVMVAFWAITVVGGLLGILAPDLSFATVAEHLMPPRFLANDFVYQLVHPSTAQTQTFLGYPVPRPKAPFVYTNDWGGVFALVVPFVMAIWSQITSLTRRGLLCLLAGVSLLPVVFSLNRVLWVCLVVGIAYGSVRFAPRMWAVAVQGLVALAVVFGLLLAVGPARQLIADRIATPHSNQGRSTLYSEAAEGVGDSPLLGYGAPRPSERNPNLPSVGTQGQFWLVLFSHGIPGAALFCIWMLSALWRTRRSPTVLGLWCHVVVLLAVLQLPFYGLLPTQLHLLMLAVSLAFRELAEPHRVPGPTLRPLRGGPGPGVP